MAPKEQKPEIDFKKVEIKEWRRLWSVDYKKWASQAQRYNMTSEKKGFRENPINGMVDGGRSAEFFSSEAEARKSVANDRQVTYLWDGVWWVSSREFILIDRVNDPFLRWLLHGKKFNKIRKIKSVEKRTQAIAQLVYDVMKDWTEKESRKLSWKMTLWEVVEADAWVCRHRTLLFQILWKEAGLDIAMRKWTSTLSYKKARRRCWLYCVKRDWYRSGIGIGVRWSHK